MENTINTTQKTFREIRNKNKAELHGLFKQCQTSDAFLAVFNKILDNNVQTLGEIVSKEKQSRKYLDEDMLDEVNKNIAELEMQERRNRDLKMEKETLLLMTEQRNKNIELYLTVYLIFVILLTIIQGSIIIFK
jgi:hypothetical protein